MSYIKKIFSEKENFFWFLFSLLFATVSLFFISLGIKNLSFLIFFGFKTIYSLYFFGFLLLLCFIFYIFRKPVSIDYLIKRLIIIFLPSELLLLFGFLISTYFNTIPFYHFFKILVNLYIIGTLFYLLFKYQRYEKISDFLNDFKEKDIHKIDKKQDIIAIFIIFSVIILNISFGIYHLSEFAAVDEPLWTSSNGRIVKFWSNIFDGEFNKTMISDKPGITVALISGIGLTQVNPKNYANIDDLPTNKQADIKKFNFAFRFPIFIFSSLMLFIIYIFSKKLFGKNISLLALILIGLSPILIGISTIVNPDSIFWIFFLLSMLSHFIYLKERKNNYLFWSGIFLGLSILTKYVANILYIFYFLLIFLEYSINKSRYENEGLKKYFKKAFGDYFVMIFFSLFIFFAFLPAAWVDITRVLEGTIFSKAFLKIWPIFLAIIFFVMADIFLLKKPITEKISTLIFKFRKLILKMTYLIFILFIMGMIVNIYLGMKFYDLESILASPKSAFLGSGFLEMMFANFYSLAFGIIPLALFAIFFLCVKNIFQKKENSSSIYSFYIITFILIYYIASVIEGVSATVRYQIVIFPLAFILAAIGIYEFLAYEKINRYFSKNFAYFLLLFFSVYSLYLIKPFYFSYASFLLPKQYVLNLKDMGDGSFEAAQYLNSLPNAKNLLVWTDKRGVCTFFIGSCYSQMGLKKEEMPFDYFVVSAGRKSRTSKMTLSRLNGGNDAIIRLDKLYLDEEVDWKLEIGKRPNNFVKIINSKKYLKQ